MADKVLITDEFVLFWGGWPSQWAKSDFEIDGVTYNCCEQYMMAEKARVFGDHVALTNILATPNPSRQKALGRAVERFDSSVWEDVCRGIVYTGNLARFTQNTELRQTLLQTGGRTVVEASPSDRIWGIGLGKEDPRAQRPEHWRGRNWLGIALMQVRDELNRERGCSVQPLDAELRRQLDQRKALNHSETHDATIPPQAR